MFREHRAHHQERQIVSIQPLVAVTRCWCPCRVQGGSLGKITAYSFKGFNSKNIAAFFTNFQVLGMSIMGYKIEERLQ